MRKLNLFAVLACTLVFVVFVLFVTHLALTHFFGKPTKAGEYGDMFGLADAIFSGITLTAAFIALWYQGREVQATMQDIRDGQEAHREATELQALASLVDAVDSVIDRGDDRTYRFGGQTLAAADLRPILLDKLLADYEQVNRDRVPKPGEASAKASG